MWSYGNGFTLELTQKGRGGVPELVQHLHDDQMQYMIIRLPGEISSFPKQFLTLQDQKASNDTVRDIFIGWQGPGMKRIQAAKLKANDFEYIKESIRVGRLYSSASHKLATPRSTGGNWKKEFQFSYNHGQKQSFEWFSPN